MLQKKAEGDLMSYQSLYRKFRPKSFDEVFGQEHVTTTLRNQIKKQNIAHAYLFAGTRGTGKTSAAKIFARAVNCLNNDDGNPCNECEVCRGILDESIMDVVEMDAASNNSVEDIRDLREKAKYPPSKSKYKVYIVDEVHMLSKGAFNALLKTLEEPPKHLLFILATTEPQKLPTTIQSRCQRFDFKRISTKNIIENMKIICEKLEIDVEERGLYLIAQNADGALRDAHSILDQCVSFTDGKITYENILSILGTVNADTIFNISQHIIDKDLNGALKLISEVVQYGKDVNQFIKDLIQHFRNLMIVKSTSDVENIVEGSKEFIEDLTKQAKDISITNIIRYINILSEAENQSKWSSQPRIVLEISIIKLASDTTDLSVEGLAHRLDELEKAISAGQISIRKGNSHEPQSDSNEKKSVLESKSLTSNNKKASNKISEEKVEEDKNHFEEKPNHSMDEGTLEKQEVSMDKILSSWTDILKYIKKDRISIHALLMEGKPVDFDKNTLIISYEEGFGFHKDAIDKQQNKEYVQGFINKYLNTEIDIKFIMSSEEVSTKKQGNKDLNNELINKVKSVFGEELVEIE